MEMSRCFMDARDDPEIGVIILTGEWLASLHNLLHFGSLSRQAPSDLLCFVGAGDLAFCSGGDQAVRGKGGYVGTDGVPRLNVLDLQIQIRRLPKPVLAVVAGYAVGGGNILQMMCDLTVSLCTAAISCGHACFN